MRARLAILAALVLPVAGGCAWRGPESAMGPDGPDLAETIAALPALELPPPPGHAPSREEVMAAYQRVYGRLPDPRDDRAVGKRLADLEMSVGEDRAIAGGDAAFEGAIALYESLLDRPGEDQDHILYQLARAHDLSGHTAASLGYLDRLIAEHPHSAYLPEARFRRAEIHFAAGRYREAQADYEFVVAQGGETPYWLNASYMNGWAEFKLAELDRALTSFFTVMDATVGRHDVEQLAPSERELVNDALRVVTLALGYLDGPDTLARRMAALERPAWQYLVYRALADDYLARERYLDSVATWQSYIDQNPLDPRAPSAHLGMIDTLVAADFPTEVPAKKRAFVEGYGIQSEFWQVHGPDVRAAYLEPLQGFLVELAKAGHAEAQASGEPAAFLDAARWYEELVQTFPDLPATAEYLFLLGEAYTEAGEPARAVAAYQRVMREFPDYPDAHEAGYAAILGLDRMVQQAAPDERELWRRVKIDAQIEFAFLFAGDPRAPEAQADAADALFALGEYEHAVELAGNLLSAWPDLAWNLRRTALSIQGHGQFELGRYPAAEAAYRALLSGPLTADERPDVEERLLAAVYKQGEAADEAGDAEAAVAHYLRLAEIAPGAELAIRGHYDAVAVTEAAGETARAATLLAAFRDAHPDHALARDAAKRLAAMHEQTGDATAAAREYLTVAAEDPDGEVRRLSLYRAAELYLAECELQAAADGFREYAQRFPEPAEERLEAVHHLDALYQELGEPDRRRHWLEQKIEIHRDMGTNASPRATYLAAEAQFRLAEEARAVFDAVRLVHPLKASLQRKQEALQAAVTAFEQAAGYRVAEFTTASTFRIATLFTDLSSAILGSDRPEGLSELEQAQYEILLEEQAFPFEEKAIALHEINMRRSWDGLWDSWIEQSFAELGRLMPARFQRQEMEIAYVESIR